MATWKVIADRIAILPHPNATGLAIGKVGPFQLVVALSNGYRDGDIVVFAPERSELPDDLKGHHVNSETGISYLSGPEQNRVKRVRLRGEYSEGVTIDPAYVERRMGLPLSQLPLDEDLSEALGIAKYEPPIPASMAGEIVQVDAMAPWHEHDVEQFRLYNAEFRPASPSSPMRRCTAASWSCCAPATGRPSSPPRASPASDRRSWRTMPTSTGTPCGRHRLSTALPAPRA